MRILLFTQPRRLACGNLKIKQKRAVHAQNKLCDSHSGNGSWNSHAGEDYMVLATITMSVGAFAPSITGKPERGESVPLAELTANPEIVLSTLFTTERNCPVGSSESPKIG